MKQKKYLLLSLILLMPACSGNPLTSANKKEISVYSEPAGAAVYVMGKMMGTTPMKLDVTAVYPVTYPPASQSDYGRFTLKHPECADQTITVSSRMINHGLETKLDCGTATGQHVETPAAADKPTDQRLRELQLLKNEGLINETEYQRIRNRILQSL